MNFSIITCTYNSEDFLEKNIASVRNQNFRNFEHIFIDGFSTDKTVEIIKKYQQEFPDQVKLYQTKPKGISNAMNVGIEKSTGKYLINLHSDDNFYDDQVLHDVSNFLEENNYPDWIYGKCNIKKDDKSIGTYPNKKIWQKNQKSFFKKYLLKLHNYIPHQAVFIKKEIFQEFGNFDESLTSSMDPDLWLRIRKKTRWFYFDRIISNYSIRKGAQSSDSKNNEENRSNRQKVLKRHLNKSEILIANFINFLLENRNNKY